MFRSSEDAQEEQEHTSQLLEQAMDVVQSPIWSAIQRWNGRLNPMLKNWWRDGWSQILGRPTRVTVGTMFSCSDLAFHVMTKLALAARAAIGLQGAKSVFQLVFECEIDEERQEWLCEQFPDCEILFKDASQLNNPRAECVKAGDYIAVPAVEVLLAGPMCSDRTPANRQSAGAKGCVQAAKGRTGSTFGYALDYVRAKRPQLVIMENVKELHESGVVGNDADWVVSKFEEMRYQAKHTTMQAREYGSFPKLLRMYFVAYDNDVRGECPFLTDTVTTMVEDLYASYG